MTLTVYINLHSPFLIMLHIKFGFDWPSGFKEDVEYYGHIPSGSGEENFLRFLLFTCIAMAAILVM